MHTDARSSPTSKNDNVDEEMKEEAKSPMESNNQKINFVVINHYFL